MSLLAGIVYAPNSGEPAPILKLNDEDMLSKSINNAQIYELKQPNT